MGAVNDGLIRCPKCNKAWFEKREIVLLKELKMNSLEVEKKLQYVCVNCSQIVKEAKL